MNVVGSRVMPKDCLRLEVPFSGRRYRVDENGEIFDDTSSSISVRIVDGQKKVRLDWLFGRQEYFVGILVLLANGYFRDFPEHLIKTLRPLYKDGDCHNTRLENLTYEFDDAPLEVEDFPGFYYIPFFTRYAINRDGEMVTVSSKAGISLGEKRRWATIPPNPSKGSPGGYRYVRAVTDEGLSRILFRHQALCWTFKTYEANVRSLVCNHLNGIPGDDRLENLELTTYGENNRHAFRIGLKKNLPPAIRMFNQGTGENEIVRTIAECSEKTGLSRSVVAYRLTNLVAKNRLYSDLWSFRRIDDPTPVPDRNGEVIHRSGEGRDLIARDIHNGKLYVANGCKQLGELLSISEIAIYNRLSEESPIPFKGYCFKYLDDKRGWPVFNDRQLQIHRKFREKDRVPDGIIALDTQNRSEMFFCSRQEAASYFGTSDTVIHRSAYHGLLFRKRFKLTIFRVHEDILWSHWTETSNRKPL